MKLLHNKLESQSKTVRCSNWILYGSATLLALNFTFYGFETLNPSSSNLNTLRKIVDTLNLAGYSLGVPGALATKSGRRAVGDLYKAGQEVFPLIKIENQSELIDLIKLKDASENKTNIVVEDNYNIETENTDPWEMIK